MGYLITFMTAAVIFFAIMVINDQAWERKTLQHGCTYYESKTGEFIWKEK